MVGRQFFLLFSYFQHWPAVVHNWYFACRCHGFLSCRSRRLFGLYIWYRGVVIFFPLIRVVLVLLGHISRYPQLTRPGDRRLLYSLFGRRECFNFWLTAMLIFLNRSLLFPLYYYYHLRDWSPDRWVAIERRILLLGIPGVVPPNSMYFENASPYPSQLIQIRNILLHSPNVTSMGRILLRFVLPLGSTIHVRLSVSPFPSFH